MANAKIMVVEDENVVSMEIQEILKSLGYAVPAVASSGEEAIQKAAETRPDLVLMDIKLKGDMDGIQAAEQIRVNFNIPIVYLTAYADEVTLQQAKITEPYSYNVKPLEARELHATIEVAIHKHKADRAFQVSCRFLQIANRHTEMKPLLKKFVAEVQNFTGCAAVGIRILDEEGNIPYQAYQGFSQEFYESESLLSIKSDQCMCINVIKGEADAKLPFYTKGGSFYMNATTRFLATVSEEEKGQTRNVCNEFGYEFVALIPILIDDRILGLIHIADARENMVPLDIVEVLEGVAMQLGTAIQRVGAEEALRASEEKYRLIFENAKEGISICEELPDGSRKLVGCNPQYAEMSGYSREELMQINDTREIQVNHNTLQQDAVNAERVLAGQPYSGIFSWIRPDGIGNYIEYTAAHLNIEGSTFSERSGAGLSSLRLGLSAKRIETIETKAKRLFTVGIDHDITERKRAEEQILRQNAVLDAINKVFRETLTCETDEEVARTCLAVAEELTASKFGWIGEVNQAGRLDTIALSNPGWDACRMSRSNAVMMIKDMEVRGIWGRVLKDEQSLIVNAPASHPDSVGTPEGHPQITCFLGVPLKHASRTIGMIGLANKESGYDLTNQQAVETLSVAFIEALNRKRAEEQIEASLKEKEVLLKEIHHRVKNNLQVISSLLDLQADYVEDKQALEIFNESQNRIRTMALVHEHLYQSQDLAEVDFAEYIQDLANSLFQPYENSNAIRLRINVEDDISLGIDKAIPCGLILNELVSNSLKHAFPAGEKGEIRIDFRSEKDKCMLIVSNNGVEFPKDLDFRNTESLGLQIVVDLTEQLDGTVELDGSGGTTFKITFPRLKEGG